MCDCNETINKKLTEANSNTLLDIPMTLSMSENTIRATRLTVSTKKLIVKSEKKRRLYFVRIARFVARNIKLHNDFDLPDAYGLCVE